MVVENLITQRTANIYKKKSLTTINEF